MAPIVVTLFLFTRKDIDKVVLPTHSFLSFTKYPLNFQSSDQMTETIR